VLSVVVGQDIEGSPVIGDNASTVLTHHHSHVIGGQQPHLSAWKFLDHNLRTIDEPHPLELTRKRQHLAVPHSSDPVYLHGSSIYEYIRLFDQVAFCRLDLHPT
jgi:hypothetical protein